MKKILLIQAPWSTVLYPPAIGLAYIAGIFRHMGAEVKVMDLNIELYHNLSEKDREKLDYTINNEKTVRAVEELFIERNRPAINVCLKQIDDFKPDIVGFSVWKTNSALSLYLAEKIKGNNSKIKIMFGGPDCYPLYRGREYAGKEFIDIVVYGEAELTVRDIMENIESKSPVSGIKGTIVMENGILIDGGFPEIAHDLDSLPFPALDLFPLKKSVMICLSLLTGDVCSSANTVPRNWGNISVTGALRIYCRSLFSEWKMIRQRIVFRYATVR